MPFLSLVYKLKITIRLFANIVKLDGYTDYKFTQFCKRLTDYEIATKSIVQFLANKNEMKLVFLIDETAKLKEKEREITIKHIKQ